MVGHVLQHSNNLTPNLAKQIEPAKTMVEGDIANLDECQLQEDNEYIQSVLRGLDGNDRTINVYHSSIPDDKIFDEQGGTSDNSSSSFNDYLKKTNDFGVQVGSVDTSSNATSVR